MTQVQKIQKMQKSKSDDSLDRVRAAAQELHRAVSDATANPGETMKTKLLAILPKAKAVTASLKESLGAQREGVQTHLARAIPHLEAMQKHVEETAKSTGHELEGSVRRAVIDTHAAVQKVSEAVAAKRLAESTHAHS